MGHRVAVLHRVVTVFLLLGTSVFVWSMLAGTLRENEVTIHVESPGRRLIAERMKHLELMAKERNNSPFAQELDLNFVSRRRIPTGPDPIHNRRSFRLRVPPAKH